MKFLSERYLLFLPFLIVTFFMDAPTNAQTSIKIPNDILHSTPPKIIQPPNNKPIAGKLSKFIWTPISPTNADVRYDIKVVEIIEHQTPYEAIMSNPFWFEARDLPTPLCPYPLSARILKPNVSYAWQVSASVKTSGNKRIELCKSEIWNFTVVAKSDTGIVQPTDTVNPDLSHTGSTRIISKDKKTKNAGGGDALGHNTDSPKPIPPFKKDKAPADRQN